MFVSKEHKKIVLNLRLPERVTEVIPTAREIEFKGRRLVVVPHRLDEVRVLRSLGIDAPGPIRSYYDWPGRHTPFAHQIDTADFATLHPRAFILNDMGTGKTLSVLWAYDYMRRFCGLDGSMLVIGPLSTLERTWADEVWRNFPHLNVAVLHGTMQRRLALLEDGADVLVINHDGIKSTAMLAALAGCIKNGRISVVVVDELAAFRNSTTARWKALRQLVKEVRYVWGMTGTPIPNEPTDAYGQIKLIAPDRIKGYYNTFRDATMKQVSKFKWVPREGALDYVYSVMQPAIRYSRNDCIDLPPTTYITREADLTPEQARMYKDMLAKFRAEHASGQQITALNEAAKQLKLLQIVCGVAYGEDGDVVVPAAARLQLVHEIVEEAGAKTIVFVPFRGALEHVANHLRGSFSVDVVHGGISKSDRDRIFSDFQNGRDPRVLVAQPGTMSHGLTLTAADTIVWFAPITSNETYQQACARIVRPGQKRNTLIVHIESSELERRMYARLQRRQSTQGALLSMFEEENG
jgi:SNF2 family DNA or RNA helicase